MTGTLALHEPLYLTGITEKPTVLSIEDNWERLRSTTINERQWLVIEDIEASENVSRKSRLAATPARKTSAMPLRLARRCEKTRFFVPKFKLSSAAACHGNR
jgi:hypothetical protein